MGAMPGNIAKGEILERFESFINDDPKKLDAALECYADPDISIRELLTFGKEHGQILDLGNQKHLRKHWFQEIAEDDEVDKAYWPKETPMGQVIQAGLVKALETCKFKDFDDKKKKKKKKKRKQYLPIDAHWICAGSHFEVVVTLGHRRKGGVKKPNHVNMLILTPTVPFSRHEHEDAGAPEDIWVIRHSGVKPGEDDLDLPDASPIRRVRLRKGRE